MCSFSRTKQKNSSYVWDIVSKICVTISLAVLVQFIFSLSDGKDLRKTINFTFGHNFGTGEVF